MNVPHPGKKKATKKRTRRAVKARRTLVEQEQFTEKHLTNWEGKLDQAIGKVQHYRRELKAVRAKQARELADQVFEED